MIDTAEAFQKIAAMSYELVDVGAELRFDAGQEPYASIPLDFAVALEIEAAPHKAAASAMEDADTPHVRGVLRAWHSDGDLLTERVIFVVPLQYGAAFARAATSILLQEIREEQGKLEQLMAVDAED